ncbi:MAG: DNA-directed RNA polymerase subunit N [Candidatus Aenigmarchaeota archaeon]|nr:DNA-directed RNA polymerase subunit N [Candidatus Aenigmarchaeota archaeon]
MIIPVRCMTCGKQVGGLWDNYKQRVEAGESPAKVMDDLGLERYCCRALFLTHRDNLKKVSRFRV